MGQPMTPENYHQGKILIVDDTPSTISTVRTVLKEHGYKVFVATTGETALERAELSLPDLILLDILMPGMDGYETCRQLKARETTKDIPIIFMTVVTETFDKVRGFQLGAVDYVTKPVEPEELLARVKTHLTIHRLHQELQEMNRTLEDKVLIRTEELSRANGALRKSNRAYKALSECNQALLRATGEQELLQEVCRIIVENCGYHLVWIGFAEQDEAKTGRPVAQAGYKAGYLKTVNITWADTERGRETTGTAIRTGKPVIYQDILTNPDSAPWRAEAIKWGYASSAAIPMVIGNQVSGALNVYATQPDAFASEEVDLLVKIANDLAYGIMSLRTRAERKRAEEELKTHQEHLEELVKERTDELTVARERALKAQRAAEAANRAKSIFLANMSHELRTPLNAILGYAQLLKREKNLTAKQQDQLTTIHSSGEHLVTLISDLLDLTKIEAQRMEVEMTTFNLPALLRSILDASRLKAEKKSLFVRYEEVSPVPALVKGDERKLRQVLLNLLTNAIKYTEKGGVTLRVNSQQSAVTSYQSPVAANCQLPTANLLFEVEDTGIGIPREQLDAIFEPFTQMKGEDRPSEGAGLGLAICHRLIEIMGGRLSVASEVGKGSTFTVELELEVVEAVATAEKAPEKTIIGYQGERKRLLIVDDHITNLSMLVSVLDPLGFTIETADNGEEALHKAAATRPDLILLDLLMPGMDGHETLRRLRRMEGLEQVKVIGVSAAMADKGRVEAFAAACDGFLAKPVDIKELQEQLKEQLRIEWIEEEAEAAEAPMSTEVPPANEGNPQKRPPQAVVDDILEKAEWGDFTRLEKILDRLESEDKEYKGFCDRIRAYSKRFDDDAIFTMLRDCGTT